MMGMSVFLFGAPLRRNDYVSFNTVKEVLMKDQYRERYPIGATTLTDAQLRDNDCIIKYDNALYQIGDYTNPKNPLFLSGCAGPLFARKMS